MKIQNSKNYQSGFAALFVTVLIFSVVFAIGAGIFIVTYGEQKIISNITKSSQSYFAAEAGVEDILLRLRRVKNWSSPYSFSVGNGTATVTISNIIAGARTITSDGQNSNRIRKVSITYAISNKNISFYYGAQMGEGGLILDDNSIVQGNIFSNGSISSGPNARISGTAKVAKNGNRINGAIVSIDAFVDICDNSAISGKLTSATTINCTYSSYAPLGGEIATTSLPITQSDINNWKNEALAAGIISGNYNLAGGTIAYLGPKKIEGNMTIDGNAQLFITGTVWVTGSINIKNNAIIKLDQPSYGSLSGMIIGDGLITLENNSISSGSGLAGSYLMYISTSAANPAIVIKNNTKADVLFTSNGWLEIQNNTQLRQVSGYGLHLKNNASIIYEVGVQDAVFTSGPGGNWEVTSWEEIE